MMNKSRVQHKPCELVTTPATTHCASNVQMLYSEATRLIH